MEYIVLVGKVAKPTVGLWKEVMMSEEREMEWVGKGEAIWRGERNLDPDTYCHDTRPNKTLASALHKTLVLLCKY